MADSFSADCFPHSFLLIVIIWTLGKGDALIFFLSGLFKDFFRRVGLPSDLFVPSAPIEPIMRATTCATRDEMVGPVAPLLLDPILHYTPVFAYMSASERIQSDRVRSSWPSIAARTICTK